jgi:hypothetical protein
MASEISANGGGRHGLGPRWLAALALGLGLAIGAVPSSARPRSSEPTATQKETARALMDAGRTKERARDYEGALEAYIAADKIMAVPSTGLSVGRAYTALGKLVEARDVLLRVARFPVEEDEPKPYAAARREAEQLEAALVPRIPSLTVIVQNEPPPIGLRATIDGAAVPGEALAFPIKVNPGMRRVVVAAKGHLSAEQSVEVVERHAVDVRFRLEVDPNVPTEPEAAVDDAPAASGDSGGISPVAWIGFGVGGACLVVGVVTGALAMSQSSDLEEACPNKRCPPSREADLDSMTALSHTSTVTLVLAGVGAGVGLVGLLALSGGEEEPSTDDADEVGALRLLVGPASLGVEGRF